VAQTDPPPVPEGVPTARRRVSRSQFEADLVRQILGGVYPAGTKLPGERTMALSSGLSRPIVREVLRSLVERGLIEVVPARGAFVRTADSMHLAPMMGSAVRHQRATPRDLVEAREMVETRAAQSAALVATDKDVAELRQLVRAFDRARSTIERARCDLALHASIARLSGNPVLAIMFGAIAPLVLDLQLRSLADPVVLRIGGPLHHDIVDAIGAHNAAAAAAAMARHVTLARELYGHDLDVPLDELAVGRLELLLGDRGRLDEMIEDVLSGARS
jgi:GntR family transcriptional regulator, transcriptional repressor for pyruvate dehydrogenase complex